MSENKVAVYDPTTKVWTGPIGQYPYPLDTFIGDLLLESFDKNPEKVVQINHEEDTVWIAKNLKLASIRVAQNLTKLGVSSEDVIGFVVRNSENVIPLIFGCVLIGGIINPLHISFNKASIKQIFGKTFPKFVICDFDAYGEVQNALAELGNKANIFTVLDKIPKISHCGELLRPTGNETEFSPPKLHKTADKMIASIMCSSGTTGEPKAVNMSHANALIWFSIFSKYSPISCKTFTFNPIYWGTEITSLLSAVLNPNETKISTQKSFSPENLMEIVEKHKPVAVVLPPTQLIQFLNSPLSKTRGFSSVKVLTSFGSIITEDLRKKFKKAFPGIAMSSVYGMTECPCTYASPDEPFDGLNAGKIVANIQLKIVDENEKNLGFYDHGEIRIKPEFGFDGYYNDPKATADALDSEGYIKTGDVGYFDENASVYVTDRVKEVFKHNGFHVSPIELETFINKIEGVEFAVVIGIPNQVASDLPAAVVQKTPGYKSITENDIQSAVAAEFSEPKHLVGGVYFVDQLPMTPTGKVQKNIVKKMVMDWFNNPKCQEKRVTFHDEVE